MAQKRAKTVKRSNAGKPAAKSARRPGAKSPAAKAKVPVKSGGPRPGGFGGRGKSKPGAKQAARKATRTSPRAASSRARPAAKPAPVQIAPKAKFVKSEIVKVVESALEDLKAVNIKVLDVRKLTDIADTLVIASGNSDRHVRSIADRVVEFAKKAGMRPTGVEGERDGEWVLVDLQDVIVHIMLPRIREFYRLENLWDISAARREAALVAER